jgi:hypothetical protein
MSADYKNWTYMEMWQFFYDIRAEALDHTKKWLKTNFPHYVYSEKETTKLDDYLKLWVKSEFNQFIAPPEDPYFWDNSPVSLHLSVGGAVCADINLLQIAVQPHETRVSHGSLSLTLHPSADRAIIEYLVRKYNVMNTASHFSDALQHADHEMRTQHQTSLYLDFVLTQPPLQNWDEANAYMEEQFYLTQYLMRMRSQRMDAEIAESRQPPLVESEPYYLSGEFILYQDGASSN